MSRPSRRRYPILKGEEQTGWSNEEREHFCDGLDEHGKLWSKVSTFVGTKTEDQVRYFYYRTLGAIAPLLLPDINIKEIDDFDLVKKIFRLYTDLSKVVCFGENRDAFRAIFRNQALNIANCSIPKSSMNVSESVSPAEQLTGPVSLLNALQQFKSIGEHVNEAKKETSTSEPPKEILTVKNVAKKRKREQTERVSKQKSETMVSILCLPLDEKAKEVVSTHYTHVSVLLHPSADQTIGCVTKMLAKRWNKLKANSSFTFDIGLTLSADDHQNINTNLNEFGETNRGRSTQNFEKFTCLWTKDAKMRCGDLYCGLGCPEIITMKYNFIENKSDVARSKSKNSNKNQISATSSYEVPTQSDLSSEPTNVNMQPAGYYFSPSYGIVSPSPSPISYTQMGKKRITPMIISPISKPFQHAQSLAFVTNAIPSSDTQSNIYSDDRPVTPTLVVKENTSMSPHLNKSSHNDSFTNSALLNESSRHFFDNNSSFIFNTNDSIFGKYVGDTSSNANITPTKAQNLSSLFDAVEQEYSNQAITKSENSNLFAMENEALVSGNSNLGFLNSFDSVNESIFSLK